MDEEDPKAADGQADLPEERLAFALGDGRVGVLAVKGRKVTQETNLLSHLLDHVHLLPIDIQKQMTMNGSAPCHMVLIQDPSIAAALSR